jgi:hypothetical protein
VGTRVMARISEARRDEKATAVDFRNIRFMKLSSSSPAQLQALRERGLSAETKILPEPGFPRRHAHKFAVIGLSLSARICDIRRA